MKELKAYKHHVIQYLKFNVVGFINTAVDFVVFFLLTSFGLGELIAQTISYAIGIVNSYILNSMWTFKSKKNYGVREMTLFIAVNLFSLLVSLGVLWLAENELMVESKLIRKIAATIISAVVNFLGTKFIVFRNV